MLAYIDGPCHSIQTVKPIESDDLSITINNIQSSNQHRCLFRFKFDDLSAGQKSLADKSKELAISISPATRDCEEEVALGGCHKVAISWPAGLSLFIVYTAREAGKEP